VIFYDYDELCQIPTAAPRPATGNHPR